MTAKAALAACLVFLSLSTTVGAAASRPAERVLSLDQCADQYVLALAPRDAIVGVSPLATGEDSWMRRSAVGLPQRRATLESVLGARPDLVVRAWTPDARLVPALRARGVTVVQLGEAERFEDIRRNVRAVAAALGRPGRGEDLIRDMDAKLGYARGAWRGRKALYLTPSGYTAGPGTLVDQMLRAAGLTNAATAPGYSAVPLETLALDPPDALVLAFFDPGHMGRWYVGRRPLVRRLARSRTIATLSGDELRCPAWFAADAVVRIAAAAPRQR